MTSLTVWTPRGTGCPAAARLVKMTDDIIAKFNPQDPAASVSALLALRSQLNALQTTDPLVVEKRAQLDRILQACLGLEVETTISNAEVVPGEAMKLHHSAIVHSDVPVRWLGVPSYPGIMWAESPSRSNCIPVGRLSEDSTIMLPASTPLSQPYWLREEGTAGNVSRGRSHADWPAGKSAGVPHRTGF